MEQILLVKILIATPLESCMPTTMESFKTMHDFVISNLFGKLSSAMFSKYRKESFVYQGVYLE